MVAMSRPTKYKIFSLHPLEPESPNPAVFTRSPVPDAFPNAKGVFALQHHSKYKHFNWRHDQDVRPKSERVPSNAVPLQKIQTVAGTVPELNGPVLGKSRAGLVP